MKIRKGNLLQRMMAVLLSALLMAGMMWGAVPGEVYADGEADSRDTTVRYSLDGGASWQEDDFANAIFACYNADAPRIQLTHDMELDSDMGNGGNWYPIGVTCPAGKEMIIDGAGYTITRVNIPTSLFTVQQTGTVIFQNITIDGGAKWDGVVSASTNNSGLSGGESLIKVYSGGTLVLGSGAVLQNTDKGVGNNGGLGGAVRVGADNGKGTLVVKDGAVIQNNRAGNGGAIYVDDNPGNPSDPCMLVMEGGCITGNYSGMGGAVCHEGLFQMKGGSISGNQAPQGAGVCAYGGEFIMTGGEISGNGNGSTVGGGGVLHTAAFTMTGGSINGNQAQQGAGVYGAGGSTMSLSGSSYIMDNKNAGGNASNVYLLSGKTIAVPSALTEGAQIGVTTQVVPTADTPVVVAEDAAAYSGYFSGDLERYKAEAASEHVQLAVKQEINPVVAMPVSLVVHTDAGVDAGDAVKAQAQEQVSVTGADGIRYQINYSYNPNTGFVSAEFELLDTQEYYLGSNGCLNDGCSVTIHTWETGWSRDNTDHWKECSCGVKSEKAAHTEDGGTVTKQPTETEEGVKTYKCSVCGYVMRTEKIDRAEPDEGNVTVSKNQGTGVPDTNIETRREEIIHAVLTPEEQNLSAGGTDIEIILDIENIDASVQEADQAAVAEEAGAYTVGQYLDIRLIKVIGESRTPVTQTNGKIRIVLTVPDGMKNTDPTTARTYAIVRVHEGAAELLPDLDSAEDTVTIETDKFSTYALVYRDADQDAGNQNGNNNNNNNNNSGGQNPSGTTKDNEPKTGDTAPVEIYATLAMVAGFSYLMLFFRNRKRGMTEQEKKELTASIIAWGRAGGRLRRAAAITLIFIILFYYHSIGKRLSVDWRAAYGE